MYSKRVHQRSNLAADIAGAVGEWSEPTSAKLVELLSPYLGDGETMPDLAFFQQLLGRLVADRGSRLSAGDDVLQARLVRAHFLRRQRDEVAEELRDMLRSARFLFDQTSGRGTGKKMGIGHGLSWMAPMHLARVGKEIAWRLESVQPGKKAKFGGLPDPATLAAAIVEQSDRLQNLLLELGPQQAGSNLARGEQMKGLEATEYAVRRCAGILSELYKLSGFKTLAKRIRPVFRRKPRRKKNQPPAPAAAPPEAAAPLPEVGILDDIDLSTIRVAENRGRPEAEIPGATFVRRRVRVRREA